MWTAFASTTQMSDDPRVLIIGGGATGTGIARDLAMRGLEVVLVEKGNLANGTTGRMHGLLHSGVRYAVADPASAKACIAENRILRETASHCIECTGGLFVQLPVDDDHYFDRKLDACRAAGIPTRVLDGDEARHREPSLSSAVERAIEVPDAAIDPFRLSVANALAAEDYGARIETGAEVTDILVDDGTVVGATVTHRDSPETPSSGGQAGHQETIPADHVINATGPWAGAIADLAGVDIDLRLSKGAMVVTNVRQVDTVINRCRPKGDADILVPHETTALLGTTDIEVDSPEDFPEEKWEVELLIDKLAELVPMLAEARTLRSYWGVRPLYEPLEQTTAETTDVTRDFFLLDHTERDGVDGFTSIVGGKFTTYRLMAERVADHVCETFGISATCRTADVPLPGSEDPQRLDDAMDAFGLRSPVSRRSVDRLGSRAREVLETDEHNPVICECEAVTRAELTDAIDQAGADLNAVRIRTRASMGNCQGAFCAQAMANLLHPEFAATAAVSALEELLEERWKGMRHALWGEQLSQAMLAYSLHANTLNRDGAQPGPDSELDVLAFDSGPALVDTDGGTKGDD